MKCFTNIIGLLTVALATGCAATTPIPTATLPSAAMPATEFDEDDSMVVLSDELSPPDQMEMSWEPKVEPAPRARTRAKRARQPQFVSNRNTRGRLFVLPTTREN